LKNISALINDSLFGLIKLSITPIFILPPQGRGDEKGQFLVSKGRKQKPSTKNGFLIN